MRGRLGAYSVHLLTATGAVLGMLALIAASSGNWPLMFAWLLLALLVDGLDGPLARRLDAARQAPAIDGALLDLVVDYLTYVFVPAFALFASGLLPDAAGWVAVSVICFGSALYFADTRMKTADRSFRGFPACWNMVVLGIFAVRPDPWMTLVVVLVLAVAMFLPVRFVHPVRTARWRMLTLAMTTVWFSAAVWAVLTGFSPPLFVVIALLGSSAYLLGAGALQQLMNRRTP